MTPRRNAQTWVTATMLQTLAEHEHEAGGVLTAATLRAWTAGRLSPVQYGHATAKMCALGFFLHRPRVINGERVDTYVLTDDGIAAIDAACSGAVRKSGPKVSRKPNPVDPQSLTARLWQLMRVRRMLDTETATHTLCDAGDPAEFERRRETVRRTLHRWASAGAIAESARRVNLPGQAATSNGCKRFVLVVDTPLPPAWRRSGRGPDA